MKVSIIVPIYGIENFIGKCATSLFEQTYKDIEFIFVNDNTQDNSIKILNGIIDNLSDEIKRRISIINKVKNEGLPQARKTGIENCTGDYILHCDGDDWIEPDCVNKLVKKIEATKADIIYFNYIKEFANDSIKSNETEFSTVEEYFSNVISFKETSGGYCWNKIIKKDLYKNIEYPVYNMHEDVALTSQLIIKAKSIAFEPSHLYHYVRYNANSITKGIPKKNINNSSLLNKFIICKLLFNQNLTDKFKKEYISLIIPLINFYAFHAYNKIDDIRILGEMIKTITISKNAKIPVYKQLISRIIIKLIILIHAK